MYVVSSDPSLTHVLCARADSIAILAEIHPTLAALRATIELPPARRALCWGVCGLKLLVYEALLTHTEM